MSEEPARVEALALTLQLVGGILLGAALVSIAIFFAPEGAAQAAGALVVAAAALVAARAVEARDRGASESILAVGLVAAASIPFYADTPAWLAALGALLAAAATPRAARSPLAFAAAIAFTLDLHHASGVDIFAATHGTGVWLLYGGMVGYGALLLALRRQGRWASGALALHAPVVSLALLPVLDRAGVTDPGLAALAIGVQLAGILLLAVKLDVRPLVASASALLGLAALTFAFLALGPALSAIILLLLGAVLVWRAEALRGYFGARAAKPAAVGQDS